MSSSRSSLWRLLAFAAALLALERAGFARADGPSDAARLADQGLALLLPDDAASFERAGELFQAALQADPKLYRARADQALLELLVAAARRDEAAPLDAGEGDALRQSSRDLRERALDELRPLVREHAQDPAVVRALAVYYGLDGNGTQTAKLVAQARARGSDPWIDFAELAADLQNASPDAAASRLTAFATAHPTLLRARMMLARAQLDRSGPQETLVTLDDVLGANPRHELAVAMKARLLAPPPARVAAVPTPPDGPPPQKPGHLPRKRNGVDAAPDVQRATAPPADR